MLLLLIGFKVHMLVEGSFLTHSFTLALNDPNATHWVSMELLEFVIKEMRYFIRNNEK